MEILVVIERYKSTGWGGWGFTFLMICIEDIPQLAIGLIFLLHTEDSRDRLDVMAVASVVFSSVNLLFNVFVVGRGYNTSAPPLRG